MNKHLHSAFWAASLALALVSCSKEQDSPVAPTQNQPSASVFKMTVNAGSTGTKTVVNEISDTEYNIQWLPGDKISVYEVGNGVIQEKASSSVLEAAGNTASFEFDFTGAPEAPYHYTFVYPDEALGHTPGGYTVTLPKEQTFAAGSFDSQADVLVSEHVSSNTRPTSLNVQFARLGATARMVIKAPDTGKRIERISLSTTEGNLAGSYSLNPATGELSDGIVSDGSGTLKLTPAQATTYSGSIVVWFRLAEITLTNNLTVSVRTEDLTYTKVIDLASASRTLQFAGGKLTKFNVDMTAVAGETNTFEGSYAEFTADDAPDASTPFMKDYGDIWAASLTKNEDIVYLNNSSYIALPLFEDEIASVQVSLSGAPAGAVVYLSASSDGSVGSALASVTASAQQTLFNLDVSAQHLHTGFLRVNTNESLPFIQMSVVTKNDSRATLDAPAEVTATLDALVRNLIHLSWDGVENAAAYRVDYTPEGQETITVIIPADEANDMEYDLQNLLFSTVYSISVTALADPYFDKDSVPAVATPTSTGAQPVSLKVDELTQALTGISGSSYQTWSGKQYAGGSDAVYAGKSYPGRENTVIQIRTNGSDTGVWTTASGGYVHSITITMDTGTNTVDVYGKNSAYTAGSQLFSDDPAVQGTLIGSVTSSSSQEVSQKLSVAGDYQYVGFRSRSGASYVKSIRIEWSSSASALSSATVSTLGYEDLKATEATLNASYTGALNGIYEAGFYWATSQQDLLDMVYPEQKITTDGSNDFSGNFSCQLSSLTEQTTYYFKAYVLEYDNDTQTYVERYGNILQFVTGSKTSSTPGGWLEMPSYTVGDMAGTTESSLSDLYSVTHYATMGGQRARNYSILYDPEVFASYWVAYPLCSSHIGSGRNESWGFDPDIPESKQTTVKKSYGVNVASSTYKNQLYSRGHQLPNADRNGVSGMMAQTYYSTNMTPQLQYGFNGNVWVHLEDAVRAVVSGSDTVYVVTGAAFRKKGGNETVKKIVSTRDSKTLPIPNYYWKVLLKVKWNGSHQVTSASSIGFWLEHRENYPNGNTNYLPYVTTVDQIEEWTGFDFFKNLSTALQSSCENNSDWNAFKNF